MFASLFMVVALAVHHSALTISPWTGRDLPSSIASAATKSRLTVTGEPGATMLLRAEHVASGWLPAFCTPSLCSPMRVSVTLPKSGVAVYQFELIREAPDASRSSGATIVSSDGSRVVVRAASR